MKNKITKEEYLELLRTTIMVHDPNNACSPYLEILEEDSLSKATELGFIEEGKDYLDEEDFYEIMQVYRHVPITDPIAVTRVFEEVKNFIRRHSNE